MGFGTDLQVVQPVFTLVLPCMFRFLAIVGENSRVSRNYRRKNRSKQEIRADESNGASCSLIHRDPELMSRVERVIEARSARGADGAGTWSVVWWDSRKDEG